MPKSLQESIPKINLGTFIGGESVDLKNGISGAFYSSLGMDFRPKASQAGILPGLKNVSNSLSDLITVMEQDLNGIRYGVGDAGHFYKVDASNTITDLGTLNSAGGAGMEYNPLTDNLYMSTQQAVSLYGQCTKTPTLKKDQFGASASIAPSVIYTFNGSTSSYDGGLNGGVATQRNNLNTLTVQGITPTNYAAQVTNTLTNTYAPPTAISESAGAFCGFVPDIEPFYGIAVYLTVKGTGDLTLTMHDSLNNNLGAVTIANAALTTGWNLFVFAAPGVRAFVNAIQSNTLSTGYHFHITSSVSSDATRIATIVANDLTGVNFVLFAHRLVQTNNGWHPMVNFNQYLCIGNGNYLSTYNYGNDSNPNNNQWVRHQLFLDVGYEITGLSNTGQYLVITAGRISNSSSRQYQGGYIYLWDGINAGFNLKVPIPMGTPYAPFCSNNVVYFICAGSFFAYAPGAPTVNKVRYIGYQNTNFLNGPDSTVVNPNTMAMRYNILHMAYPSKTTNPNLNMGIYSWGATELIYPNSFAFSHQLSNGLQNYSSSNNLQIGMMTNFVDQMYTSHKQTIAGTTTYSLDLLDNTCSLAPNFGISCLMWDGGARYKLKKGLRVKVNFTALPSGVTITPWYSIDRGPQLSQDVNNNSYQVGAGATQAFINIPAGTRAHELQWGFLGAASAGVMVTPYITGIAAEIDGLPDEDDLRPDG